MGVFRRKEASTEPTQDVELTTTPPHQATTNGKKHSILPTHNHNGHKVSKGIQPDGESGRRWINPLLFLKICFRSASRVSMGVNILWPIVPAAIAVYFVYHKAEEPSRHLLIFILNYIAMVPSANLVGFAGQEIARKVPKVWGVVLETALGSIVEIILFMVLLVASDAEHGHDLIPVIQAAILGSILATLLLCLGLCFFVGGLTRHEQTFDDAVSEVGSGLLLVAGLGLLVPSAFFAASSSTAPDLQELRAHVLTISRITALLLLAAFFIYLFFNIRSHHGVYDAILLKDELKDADRHKDLAKDKLTFTECVLALVIALTCVSMHAVFLVYQIEIIVADYGVNDNFMGLILVPIVEKAAEHLTAVDEAWDNQMNFALSHVLGSTIQTALFNAPLVVIAGWGLHKGMDLQFEVFFIAILIIAIIVVGNFLRDGKSNYLEGALCVIVYIIIAVSTFFYESTDPSGGAHGGSAEGASKGEGAMAEAAGEMAKATGEAAHRLLFG
ncbi:MAG: hypothetical protein M1825_002079 [Sarcosagium campestre]|nr:MAG: hypothetical protein M1825_002079 [Sarcosagium campestre]